MEPYQQRVVREKEELDKKIEKLMAFFGTELYRNLSDEEKDLLDEQYRIMQDYSSVLGQRIDRFKK